MNYIEHIEAKGFSVKGRHIYKRSQKTNRLDVCGILNESSFYMFSENVYPFKYGLNYFDNKTLVDYSDLKKYVRQEIKQERNDFDITFEQFSDSSSNTSNLVSYYNNECKKYLARPFKNYFDVKNYENFTAFPFIDYNGDFKTAQLIKYNDTGKRVKTGYSTTWLHSHKQAKKRLGLKTEDKYSVKINCFFGEHYLKDSTKPIAIVEAPKTATILKMMHPKIDWIATAGESGLFNKDLSILRNRKVIFYADCETTQWKEFAQKNGYSFSDVLERNNCEAGSDLADYVFDSSHQAYTDIHSELYAISEDGYNFKYNTDLLELNFKNNNSKIEYFTAVPMYYKGIQVYLSQDNSIAIKATFRDSAFTIFEKDYNFINAQIDWHRQVYEKNEKGILIKIRGFNEKEFIKSLHECYSVLKYLNKNADVDKIFGITLNNLISESNFSFNSKYVLDRLLPVWRANEQNLTNFVKQRNWKYLGKQKLSRNNFIAELNNSRFRTKLMKVLKGFKALLEEGNYIKHDMIINDINASTRGFKQINEMRKEWNKKVLGTSTKKQAEKTKQIIVCTKNASTIYKITLYSGLKTGAKHLKNLKKINNWSNSILADSLGVTRNDISKFLSFKSDLKARKRIFNKVNNLLDDLTNVEPIRSIDKKGKKRITDFKIAEDKKDTLIKIDVSEAFTKPNTKKIAS